MKKIKNWSLILFTIVLAGVLVGCGEEKDQAAKAEGQEGIRKVKVAYAQAGKPVSYTDENGKAAGYDVEILKAVAEKLPQYEFEFIGTSDDDLLIGIEQGKYQLGVKNAFFTDERAKKFIYPKEFIGLSSIGFIVKKEHKDVQSLKDFAEADFSLAPIAANNAQYAVISEFNEANPNKPINLKAGDTFKIDVVQWVNENRVDGAVIIEASFNQQVINEDGPYHHLKDDVLYNEFDVIKTWPLFNKKEQQLADDFDEALKQVKEEKTPNALSEAFYGRDLFELLDEVKR